MTTPKASGLPSVAIVGTGIAGLAAAHALRGQADITLYEAGDHFGGHTHTVDVTLPTAQGPRTHGVDTGFLVFNERTYPKLIQLFGELTVPVAKSEMSFSVQVPQAFGAKPLEWSGHSLNTVFAQRRNLLRPAFLGMLADVVRFNRLCTLLAERGEDADLTQPLGHWLASHRFGTAFQAWYFLPMMGCIWSCPTQQMLEFPVATMIRFCHNHGLLQVSNRPQWFTVAGGARQYVERIVAQVHDKHLNAPVLALERLAHGVKVITAKQQRTFDEVVLAVHSDQALSLLGQGASAPERKTLGAIGYQANTAVLHTDDNVLPKCRNVWAAWNFENGATQHEADTQGICLHYLLNRLQPLPFRQPVVVSLNPKRPIDQAKVLGQFEYAHPIFNVAAIRAQQGIPALQGVARTWFCGAWTGYGFHEDGLKSGLAVAQALLAQWQLRPQHKEGLRAA